MSVKVIKDPKSPLGKLLVSAKRRGVILESKDHTRFALLRLNDDLLDFLLTRSPRFVDECRRIRERMSRGEYYTHEQVTAMFAGDLRRYGSARASKGPRPTPRTR